MDAKIAPQGVNIASNFARQKAFSLGVSLDFASLKSGSRVCCGNPQLRYRSKPRLVRGFLASAWDIAARPYFTAYVTKRFRPNG